MALGATPVPMLHDRRQRGGRANRVQQPGRLLVGVLLGQLFGGDRRAVEIAVVPKRSMTYFGSARPARAPRLAPLGRDVTPTEQLRRTLVARTRYVQDQVRQQGGGASQSGGGGQL